MLIERKTERDSTTLLLIMRAVPPCALGYIGIRQDILCQECVYILTENESFDLLRALAFQVATFPPLHRFRCLCGPFDDASLRSLLASSRRR